MIVGGMTYKQRMSALKCTVVIPTYNNATTISQVIADIQQYTDNIIVVNDGSTDNTTDILSVIKEITVIDYKKNKGKGYALKLGLEAAYNSGYRYAITIDSDGQHYADDIPIFLDKIENHPDSLLIGARNLTADNMPSKNTFANKFSNFWYKVETGKSLSDTQSGYRLYPLHKLQNIHFITRRYEFELEILVRAAWRGIKVENVPIKVFYASEGERVSHFRPVRDFARISLLNAVLVGCALLWVYPLRFLRSLSGDRVKGIVRTQLLHSRDSNMRLAMAMGWGMFCGIAPIWGWQMVFAGVTAHALKLNKVVAMVFSNVSIPPMIPFILYGSMVVGARVLNIDNVFSLDHISMAAIGLAAGQYLIGSLGLAVLAGFMVFLSSWGLMHICKRRR